MTQIPENRQEGAIYKLVRTFLKHNEIKEYLKSYGDESVSTFLTNVSQLAFRLVRDGFRVNYTKEVVDNLTKANYDESMKTEFRQNVANHINNRGFAEFNKRIDAAKEAHKQLKPEVIVIDDDDNEVIPPNEEEEELAVAPATPVQPEVIVIEDTPPPPEQPQQPQPEQLQPIEPRPTTEVSNKDVVFFEDRQVERFMRWRTPEDVDIQEAPSDFPKMILINKPAIWKEAKKRIEKLRYKPVLTVNGDVDEPVADYHFNQIHTYQGDTRHSICGAFKDVIDINTHLKGVNMFRIKVSFSLLIEKNRTTESVGYERVEEGHWVKYEMPRAVERMSNITPYTFMVRDRAIDTQKYLEYLNMYIYDMMEKNFDASSTKFIGITGVSFYVYRTRGTGSAITGLEPFIKNQNVYSCLTVDGMCVLECIYIARFPEEYKRLKGSRRNIYYKLREQYKDIFGQNPSKDLESVDIYPTLYIANKKYEINFNILSFCDDKYEQEEVIETSQNNKLVNLLLFCGRDVDNNTKQHVMFIKDLEKLTKLHTCPHCHYIPPATQHECYNKERFDRHVANCTGTRPSRLKLSDCSVPYVPHIFKNPVFAYLLAHNRINEYQYITEYMTYDFETVQTLINEKFGDKSRCNAELSPMSVAWSCRTDTTETSSMFIGKDTQETFINNWLDRLFVDAQAIYKNREIYYDTLNLPEFICKKLGGTKRNKYGINVKVLGFNSKKFDVNVFVNYITNPKIKFEDSIGTSTQYKALIISHTDFPFEMQFLDLKSFLGPGDLDKWSRVFGKSEDRVKGFFPYESLNILNFTDELSKSEPFEQKDFYSSLTGKNLSDEDYKDYLKDAKQYPTRLTQLLAYNEQDTKIMIPIIDYLIKKFAEDSVDMLRNFSLSSCASQTKYAGAYEDFYIEGDYSETKKSTFVLSKEFWERKVLSYKQQDEKAERYNTKNNVSKEDYEYFEQLFKTSKCYICKEGFTFTNKPTLDRIDNNKPHTKDNVKPCCCYCNRYKSDKDERWTTLFIQLRKFALKRNLPMTLTAGDDDQYRLLRDGIAGGLSNVHNRRNIKGYDVIKNLTYKDGGVEIIYTNNKITHCIGLDFNSQYPSSYAGLYHELNPYTDGVMFMPGRCKYKLKKKEDILRTIHQKKELFVVSVKGHIDPQFLHIAVMFPPVIRNLDILTNEETIGNTMYKYMKDNEIPVDRTTRKLTQLTDTHDTFMTFSSYYLWFLIDTCHFIIDDVKEMYVYTKHTGFKTFVERYTRKRQMAKLAGDGAADEFYKMCLNGAYGYDIMNEENFTKTEFCSREKTFLRHLSPYHSATRKINSSTYQVQMFPRTYHCNTCIVEGFFTLDNAKFWYLNFIYNFMFKCLDMTKIHVVELDTDSIYLAVSGSPEDGIKQGFKHVIKDHKFYNKNVYKYLPSKFYSSDNSNPTFTSELDQMIFDKKLMGAAIEKQCESMVALAPKTYICFNSKEETVKVSCKGYSDKEWITT
jgi:hypothetical protein